jgi:hypothetical protein
MTSSPVHSDTHTAALERRILAATQVLPDFPRPGVTFRDLGGLRGEGRVKVQVCVAPR